jgi:hypothetical protein
MFERPKVSACKFECHSIGSPTVTEARVADAAEQIFS